MLTLDAYEAAKAGKLKRPVWAKDFVCIAPEGTAGPWTVEQFEIGMDLQNLRMMRDGRGCVPGVYTRLHHKNRGVVMSDTTAEAADHMGAMRRAKGRVLIHGLGLGCYLNACLSKPSVEHVDVVEIDADVMGLVAPSFEAKYPGRVTFHHDDCFTRRWPSGVRWGVVWHDVWDSICEDNREAMTKLARKFGRRCDWQGFWGRDVMGAYRR